MTTYWRAITLSGRDGGLRAFCDVCSGGVPHSLQPGGIFEHCGHEERVPRNTKDLPPWYLGTTDGKLMFVDAPRTPDHAAESDEAEDHRRAQWV